MVTDETCKDKIVDDKYYSTKDLILNQSKNSLLGLVSLKDVFFEDLLFFINKLS